MSLTLLGAWRGSTQSSTCVEGGLLSIFLSLWSRWHWASYWSWQLGPWPSRWRTRFRTVMGYVTAFATEEAKVAVHSLLLLLLGQLAILSEFGREVGVVAVGRAGGWSSRVVGG